MTRPSLQQVRALARALLNGDGADQGAEETLRAVERVLSALARRIDPLIGSRGFQMLLQRALKQAQRAHPSLAPVRSERTADPYLTGLDEVAQIASPEEATAAAEAIVAELVGLLARFVGADMAIRLVRQSFPNVFLGGMQAGTGTEKLSDD